MAGQASIPVFFVLAGLVPAIHVFLRSDSFKDVDARHKAGHDDAEVFGRSRGTERRDQPDSAAFTRPLALPKSIWPANFARSTPITLPMSFIPAAPVSAIAAAIAAFTSSSDICLGK